MLNANKSKDELQDILKGKEYQIYYDDHRSIILIWWEKAKEWLGEQLAKLFPSIETASGAAAPILITLIIVVIALLGWIMFLLIRIRKRNRMMRVQKPLHSMKEMNWSSQKHLSEADRQEALGEYTLSTRHMFLALLFYFHEKEWLEARIWKTNWDYYDELRKVNQLWADQFYHLAYFFDEATYGEHTVEKEQYIQFRSEANKLLGETDKLLDR
ncbi:DUF4129 domain-containing protein [Lederbergia citrea]|uniref:DUF4129 domain-containing protein n=1 Tax=Lederbergia citrea TaxID=2833581 RepID=A0A942UN33_9BACI|nr:DUF4129 domain-containing protein [Lederbergia citrea]MBS4176831.1 DUF4129 domain-containing protein [Lederbergia citrea]MBS4203391.1 DUF4129 domain-containing protein [Lederbergia citrea]MBS4221936.1 DUF4129 domain-containing protein [Lederbergia citrea]